MFSICSKLSALKSQFIAFIHSSAFVNQIPFRSLNYRHRRVSPISASATKNIIVWCIPAVLRCAVIISRIYASDSGVTSSMTKIRLIFCYFRWISRYFRVAVLDMETKDCTVRHWKNALICKDRPSSRKELLIHLKKTQKNKQNKKKWMSNKTNKESQYAPLLRYISIEGSISISRPKKGEKCSST